MDKVLVTGATGFIALHCIYYLLKRGYAVHGTVRSLDRKQEVLDAMLKQGLSTDNLNLFEADLLDDKNWDEAVAGCKYVLHVASPVIAGIPKDENDLIQPAIQGTVRVLEASKNTGTVHKAVVTSSVAAVSHTLDGRTEFTDEDWSDITNPKISAYSKSKVLAERAAWDFVAKHSCFQLTTLHPAAVCGPMLSPDIGTSNIFVKRLIDGSIPGNPKLHMGFVDVRDVAKAHVDSLTNELSDGRRIILSNQEYWISEISAMLRDCGYKAPKLQLPKFLMRIIAFFDKEIAGVIHYIGLERNFVSTSAKDILNWDPIDVRESVKVTADQLKAMGEI
tara:strand:+ start:572 stop:1573 length:1002 start_codon:yes stop_codon:yes gene_type:complete